MKLLCRLVERELTAFWDGQLAPWRQKCVLGHLARCRNCDEFARDLKSTMEAQKRALQSAEYALTVPIEQHLEAVLGRLERESPAGTRWSLVSTAVVARRLRWAAAAAAIAALLLAIVESSTAHLIRKSLMALGVRQPPAEVVQATEFFQNYPLLENLDWLENWERVSQSDFQPQASEDGKS